MFVYEKCTLICAAALVIGTQHYTAAHNNQRMALVNLAKSLSSNLQTTLTQTSAKLTNLTNITDELDKDVERLDEGLSECLGLEEKLEARLDSLQNQTTSLQDRREMDLAIWNYNNLICNASLEAVRNNLELRISELSDRLAAIPAQNNNQQSLQLTINNSSNDNNSNKTNKTNVYSGTLNLLDDLSSILEDYEYYEVETEEKEVLSQEMDKSSNTSFVSSLVDQTNKLLLDLKLANKDLGAKFTGLEFEVTEMKEKMLDKKVKQDIDNQINELRKDIGFRMSRIRDDIQQGDADTRNEIKLKVEDIGFLKQVTGSRLSVYETRLGQLEEMVLNISLARTQDMEQFLNSDQNGSAEVVTVSSTTTTTPEETTPEYSMSNELDNFAASLLSPTSPSGSTGRQWSRPTQQQPSSSSFLDNMPSREQMDQWRNGGGSSNGGYQFQGQGGGYGNQEYPSSQQGGYGGYGRSDPPNNGGYPDYPGQRDQRSARTDPKQPEAVLGRPPRPRSGRNLQFRDVDNVDTDYSDLSDSNDGADCNCPDIKERLAILESGFENIMTEVETQMSGIQLSMTRMMHKIQDMEAKQISANNMRTGCVASKKAADLEEMDAWCAKWCPQGMCPSELCTCPQL